MSEEYSAICKKCGEDKILAYFLVDKDSKKTVGEIICPKCDSKRIDKAVSVMENCSMTFVREVE